MDRVRDKCVYKLSLILTFKKYKTFEHASRVSILWKDIICV